MLCLCQLPAAEERIDIADDFTFALPAFQQKGKNRPGVEHPVFDLDLIVLYSIRACLGAVHAQFVVEVSRLDVFGSGHILCLYASVPV